MQLYCGDDFSLGEISEDYHVSRQAVYDNIRRTEKILGNLWKKAASLEEFTKRNQLADEIQGYVAKQYPNDQQLNQLVNRLESAEEEWKLGA